MRRGSDLEKQLTDFAEALMTRAKAPNVDLGDAVKVFKEVVALYAILTAPPETGDKPRGRRSTMASMRSRIDRASGASSNGRAEPTVSDAGG